MHRLAILLALVALVVAVPATHTVFAKATKVDVCHVNSANQPGIYSYDWVSDYIYENKISGYTYEYHYDYTYTITYHLGKVTSVAEDAVDAHVAHGDSTRFYALSDAMSDWIEALGDYGTDYEYGPNVIDTPTYYRYYYYKRTWNNESGVVKNADCYWTTYERVDN